MNKLNIYKPIFLVILDGEYIGATNNEYEIWEIAQDCTNGTPYPLNDDNFCDRVWYDTININRYFTDRKNICDKLSNDSILCSNYMIARDGAEQLNKLQLEKERAEAKCRALLL